MSFGKRRDRGSISKSTSRTTDGNPRDEVEFLDLGLGCRISSGAEKEVARHGDTTNKDSPEISKTTARRLVKAMRGMKCSRTGGKGWGSRHRWPMGGVAREDGRREDGGGDKMWLAQMALGQGNVDCTNPTEGRLREASNKVMLTVAKVCPRCRAAAISLFFVVFRTLLSMTNLPTAPLSSLLTGVTSPPMLFSITFLMHCELGTALESLRAGSVSLVYGSTLPL